MDQRIVDLHRDTGLLVAEIERLQGIILEAHDGGCTDHGSAAACPFCAGDHRNYGEARVLHGGIHHRPDCIVAEIHRQRRELADTD